MTALLGFASGAETGGETLRRALARRIRRIFGRALLLLAGGAVVAAVGSESVSIFYLIYSLFPIAAFGLTAVAGWFLMRQKGNPFARVGALAAVVSIVSGLIAIAWVWTLPLMEGDETTNGALGSIAGIGLVWSLALAHVSLLLAARQNNDGRFVKRLIWAGVGVTAGLGVAATLAIATKFVGGDGSFWLTPGSAAFVALVVTGLLAVARCSETSGGDER